MVVKSNQVNGGLRKFNLLRSCLVNAPVVPEQLNLGCLASWLVGWLAAWLPCCLSVYEPACLLAMCLPACLPAYVPACQPARLPPLLIAWPRNAAWQNSNF